YRRGVELVGRNVTTLEAHLKRRGVESKQCVNSRTFLAWCLAELGEFADATAAADEAIAIAEAAASAYWPVHACSGAPLVRDRLGARGPRPDVPRRGVSARRTDRRGPTRREPGPGAFRRARRAGLAGVGLAPDGRRRRADRRRTGRGCVSTRVGARLRARHAAARRSLSPGPRQPLPARRQAPRGRRAPRRRDHRAPPARHDALAGERRAGARAARPLTQSRTALQGSLAERAHQDQRLDPVVGSETRADEAHADVVERVGYVERPRPRPYPLEGGARARLKCSGQHDPRARKRDAAGAGKIPTLVAARQFPAQLATLLEDPQSRGIPPTSLRRPERSAPCPEHRQPPR